MKHIKSFFRINPIIVKELRSRMRGSRAFLTLTISLVVTGGILYGLLQVMIAMSQYASDILSPRIGQTLFIALAFLELVIVCAVTPAVTAGAISSERERQTYEMLQATPLSPARLLWGKLIAALGYIFLLLFAAVPLASLVFIFGGVVLRDMFKAMLVLLVLTGTFGVLGLFMSVLFKRTGRATVASFVVVALLVFAPIFITIAIGVMRQSDANLPRWLLALSPISMLMSTMDINGGTSIIYQLLPFFGGYWMTSSIAPTSMVGIPRPLYHYGVPIYLGLSLVMYLLASRLLHPGQRWRMKAREWALGIGLVLAFAAGVAGLYLLTADRYERVSAPVNPDNPLIRSEPAVPVPAAVDLTVTEIVEVTVDPNAPVGTITVTPTPTPLEGGLNSLPPTPSPVQPGGGNSGSIPFTPVPQASLYLDQPAVAGEIFAAVARYVLTIDSKLTPPPVLYILDKTDDGAGDPSAPANSSPLPEEVKAEISRRLADLKVPVEFVASRDDLIVNAKSHEVKDGGAVISFGNIRSSQYGQVEVPGSIYWSGKAARGDVYILNQWTGAWGVTSGTAEWVS